MININTCNSLGNTAAIIFWKIRHTNGCVTHCTGRNVVDTSFLSGGRIFYDWFVVPIVANLPFSYHIWQVWAVIAIWN